jgi:ribosomal protein S18 acetylase RimI-like enzyme
MNADLLTLFDRQLRREAMPDDAEGRIARDASITRAYGPGRGPEDNCILWFEGGGDAAALDRLIARERARAEAEGRALEWKLYGHDRPEDMGARLAAQGFEPEEPETLVAFDLRGALPGTGTIAVRRIGPDELGLIDEVSGAVWGAGAAGQAETLGRTLRQMPEHLSIYLAQDTGGRPASVGWMRKPAGAAFATLWGGATVPQLRGRGFYRALVAARLAEAKAAGYRHALVEARETSRPILERLGFERLTTVRGYVWAPGRGAR